MLKWRNGKRISYIGKSKDPGGLEEKLGEIIPDSSLLSRYNASNANMDNYSKNDEIFNKKFPLDQSGLLIVFFFFFFVVCIYIFVYRLEIFMRILYLFFKF
jgi:hypothetical protein